MKINQFTLILPTLNEEHGLLATLPAILRVWNESILVVDGGSSDKTIKVCEDYKIPFIKQTGKGVPNAEKEGVEHINSEFYIIFTPDGNSIPDLLPKLKEKTLEGYDMVIVSRYLDGAKSYDDDFFTGIGNKVFTEIVNLFFQANYTDTLVGFRCISKKAIQKMGLLSLEKENYLRKKWFYVNSWELGSSIRAARLGLKRAEIPGDEPKRIGGVRKLSILKNGFGSLIQILMDLFWRPM